MENLYKDIKQRTGGEIYIGVVGPVRTGKSTFIEQFFDLSVLPFMEDEDAKQRAIDEMPQSAQGKTIMTTEPKFIPQEAAKIKLSDGNEMKVRLIDCVGFMVDGATGHMEEDVQRMVRTPWNAEEIPFVEAARIGTEKVIKDHCTIGIVLTTDGSFGDIPRENYGQAEKNTIHLMKQSKKPFLIILNCKKPYSEEAKLLKEKMEEEYKTTVLPLNCKQLHESDITKILEQLLYEFPVTRMDFRIPKWMEIQRNEHPMKKSLIEMAGRLLKKANTMRDIYDEKFFQEVLDKDSYIKAIDFVRLSPEDGSVELAVELEERYYFQILSEMTGVAITGEYQMIAMIKELSLKKKEYEKVQSALKEVEQKGYGVVLPNLTDITMEDPLLITHGNKYGVKMRATSPSIHMIKANIETEIAPIVGSKEQAQDLINYIKEGEASKEGVWTTNIFGKSVGELMEDGIKNKISQMDDECQMKLQDTMQKIVNDMNGGLICIII